MALSRPEWNAREARNVLLWRGSCTGTSYRRPDEQIARSRLREIWGSEIARDALFGSGLVIDFRGMNDKTFVALFVALGTKLYELQTGFAAMFILNTDRGSFTREDFLKVKGQVEASEEMKKLRHLLDTLRDPKEPVDFEKLLREFQGPVQ